jgi:hypothetical protein
MTAPEHLAKAHSRSFAGGGRPHMISAMGRSLFPNQSPDHLVRRLRDRVGRAVGEPEDDPLRRRVGVGSAENARKLQR